MKYFLVWILFFGCSVYTFGQNVKLTGTVYDSNGSIVVKADVRAISADKKEFSAKSTDDGIFLLELVPGIYAIEVSGPGFLTIKYDEYLVVNSTKGKMTMDFVMFGGKYHEPCGYSGADCLPANLLIKPYKVEYSPKLKKIRDDFAPETKQKKQ